MIAMLAAVLASSLLGSVHCVAMCGPLLGMFGRARSLRLAASHAAGRLATYAALGAGAGLVGSAIDLAGRLAAVQRAATIAAGAAIAGFGLYQLATARGRASGLGPRASARSAPQSRFASALVRLRPRAPGRAAYVAGVLTGLLPCGWLWAFVIGAAGTGSPLDGALVMAAFWLGTVPAMVGLLGLAGPVVARLRARLPEVTACVLIALGLGTLALRWRDAGATQVTHPHCLCHEAR